MTSLNDVVSNRGLATDGVGSYDPAKRTLVGELTQHDVSVFGGAAYYNEGLYLLAESAVVYFSLLMETGDRLLLESGDRLFL